MAAPGRRVDEEHGQREFEGVLGLLAGLSMAFGEWSEAGGAFVQLLVNVVILIVVGAIGLAALRRIWGRTGWRTGARRS